MTNVALTQLAPYNAIYGWGLSDATIVELKESFKAFSTSMNECSKATGWNTCFSYSDLVIFYTGVNFKFLNEDRQIVFICDSYNRQQITILETSDPISRIMAGKKYEKDSLFFTGLQFIAFKLPKNSKEMVDCVSNYLRTDVGRQLYSKIKDVKYNATSEEVLREVRETKKRSTTIGKLYNFNTPCIPEQIFSTIADVYDEPKEPILAEWEKKKSEFSLPQPYALKVLMVKEYPRTRERLAILGGVVKYGTSYKSKYISCLANADNPLYNYLDEGKIMTLRGNGVMQANSYQERALTSAGAANLSVFVDEKPFLPEDMDLFHRVENEIYRETRGQAPLLLQNNRVQELTAAFFRDEKRKEQLATRAEVQKNALLTRIDTVTKDDALELNNVKFFSDRIEYNDQVFKASCTSPKKIYKALLSSVSVDNINFDTVLANFLSEIRPPFKVDDKELDIQATVGEVDVNYKTVKKSTNTHHYVNDIRINKGEVKDVLRQALCFTENKQFNAFLKQVSACSLKIHQYLAKGFEYTIRDDFTKRTLLVKLPVERINGKNFINIKGHNHRVKNIASLVGKSRNFGSKAQISLGDFITMVGGDSCLALVDYKKIGELLEKAKDAYEEAVKKSEELLKLTEKTLGLKLVTLNIGGAQRTGYEIKGVSGNVYFVDANDKSQGAHGGHYPVFWKSNGNPICIVDKASSMAQVGKDALVNRLFALKNDQFVAKHISTLQLK